MVRRGQSMSSLVAMAVAAGSLAIHAQRPPAGTLDGIWNYATMTPLERPRDLAAKPVLTPGEAADYERQTIERQRATNNTAGPDWWDPGTRFLTNGRTSLIVDPAGGRVPAQTAEAQQRAAARAQARRARGSADGPEDRALNERCLNWTVAGPPMLPGVYNNNVQIIETRDYVALVSEMIHDARIIPLNAKHKPAELAPWMGDSIGWYDRDTLVVETVNMTRGGGGVPISPTGKITERFTRYNDKQVFYEFEVDDPTLYTQVWKGQMSLNASPGLYEYACHEGNYALHGILAAGRQNDRKGISNDSSKDGTE